MIHFLNHLLLKSTAGVKEEEDMNLDQLEVVEAILQNGSFRAAAEALHRSQPALSSSIKNLEDEFGIQIFDRNTYRPKLTEAGAVFVQASRKALEAAHYTARIATELGQKKAETKLRVAVDPLVPIEAIECIAQECARPLVPVALILEKTLLQRSYHLLLDGTVDLALAPCPENDSKIERIQIGAISLVGAISKKLLQEKRNATASFLKKQTQILVYDKDVDEPPDQLMPHPIYSSESPKIFTPDHFTKLQLIQGGLGWGRISKTEFEQSKDLVLIDEKICPRMPLTLCIMRPKLRSVGPIARAVWNVFAKNSKLG